MEKGVIMKRLNIRFWILDWYIELNFKSKHKWSHFKINKHRGIPSLRHLVFGPISLTWWQPQNETIRCCAECDSYQEIGSFGSDGLDICGNCSSIEGKTREVSYWELIQAGEF